MPGFKHDPLADVEAIRQLLSGYETGFPFLKEVVQNANDADASRVWMQWHQGLANEASHPLLKGPALIIVNDGPFNKESRDGIQLIGLSNRAADTERIGRFGLGVKSLFHVCEGFFFLESGEDEALRGFLTPWHGETLEETEYHRDWWQFSPAEWKTVNDSVKAVLPQDFQQWFAIWIPLRRAGHLGEVKPLRNDHPGDEHSCPRKLTDAFLHQAPSIAESMIFLQKVDSVTFHDGDNPFLMKHERPTDEASSGLIQGCRYYKRGLLENDAQAVAEFQGKPNWPTVTDRRTTEQVPDKAKWEGGVAVSLKPAGASSGSLRLFWSVFLPVGNHPAINVELPGCTQDIHVFVHGFFFPNRDRTAVLGADNGFNGAGDDNEDSLKIAWNKKLATSLSGVLALLLPTVMHTFVTEKFSDAEILKVVSGLEASEWFRIYQQHVCQTHSLVRNLDAGNWEWRLVESTNHQLVFPKFDEPSGSATEGIVADLLGGGNQDRVIIIQGNAALAARELTVEWTKDDLEWFCGLVSQEDLKRKPNVRVYLTKLFTRLRELVTRNPEAWNDLPIYEVESLDGAKTVVSAKALQSYYDQGTLFANGDTTLKDSLKKACPTTKAWFVVGTIPPGLSPADFNQATAANLVLKQEQLALPSHRSALIANLLSEVSNASVKSAIRYLLHGSFDNSKAGDVLFMRINGNDPASKWNEVVKTVLEHKAESWRLVDATFAAGINDEQKGALGVKMCSADAFRSLCKEADEAVGELPLHAFHDFLLTHLNEGTHYDPEADNRLLHKLKIHRYGVDSLTTMDEAVWLAPEAGKEPPEGLKTIWNQLCQNAKIVQRSQSEAVGLRQRQLFQERILDPNGIIRLACQQKEPQRFAKLILHYLNSIGNPAKETSEALRIASWLPLAQGRTTRLSNLLWLDGAEESLVELIPQRVEGSTVVLRGEIQLPLADSPGAWNTIRAHLIPKGDDVVELLKTAFGNNPKLHVGLPKLPGSDALGAWLTAVEGCEAGISPVVTVIRALWPKEQQAEVDDKRTWAGKVAAVFAREWSGEVATRYDTALEALRNRHEEADVHAQDVIIRVFHDYLAAAVRAGRWEQSYCQDADFKLLNQEGNWTSASQLVVPITGIARRALADQQAVAALELTNQGERDEPLPGAIIDEAGDDVALSELLRGYGNTISEHLPPKLWGIFIALLGETPAIRRLADQLTDGRTETIRDDLCGPFAGGINPRCRVTVCRYSCSITDGDTAQVVALNGDVFDAPLDMDQAAFLVAQADGQHGHWWLNRFFVNTGADGVHYGFRLCDPAAFTQTNFGQMCERLEQSVTRLLTEVLHVTGDRIGKVRPLMDKIMGLGQMSLGRAQQEILATAQIHLSQLGIRPSPGSSLSNAIKKLDEATSLESQAREEREQDLGEPERNEKAARKARDEGLLMLRRILQTDDEVHHVLTGAMKTRISREQYVAESVPFELFQNGDDAIAQLPADHHAPRVFVLEIADGVVRCAHWGRPINHPSDADGELKRSYERDLLKMLILHGSDKQASEDDAGVTGKFGLGFKSVYLISDNPRVVSGDLAFDVVGAIYPRRLDTDQTRELSDKLSAWMPNHQGGTVIELPTTQDTTTLSARFADLASYLVIFAREIREIRLRGLWDHVHFWNPERVQSGDGWELWVGDAGIAGKLIHLKCGEVSWLFGLDQHGIRKLTGLPCIWATAPLHSTGEVGFAINGPFDPDPGRTELGKGEAAERRNSELFQQASTGLCDFLKWCAGQDNVCGTLELQAVTKGSFWKSMWELFSSLSAAGKDASARARVSRCVWPKEGDSGYAGAAKRFPIIPNGLPGSLESLTSSDQVRFEVSGYLASSSSQELLASVAEWDEWGQMDAELRVTSENVVSGVVAGVLKRQMAGFNTEPFTLPFLIRRLAGIDLRLTPHLSKQLGRYLNTKLWESGYDWPQRERTDLEDFLGELQFQNESEEWVPAAALLICQGSSIESGRAAFAPAERRLHQQYPTELALHFFRLCRGEMRVTPEEMAGWITQAIDENNQERVAAALRFLASTADEHASKAAGLLSADSRQALLNHAAFLDLTPEDQNRVKGAFLQADMSKARLEGREYEPARLEAPFESDFDDVEEGGEDSSITIQDLIDAWHGNEQAAVQQFTVSGIYSAFVFPDVADDDDLGSLLRDTDSIVGKQHWYRLLCLGCSMSIPLGRNPASRIIPFWRDRLNDDFWAATIPQTLDEAKTSGFDQRLDAFFEDIIHQSFRSESASGEDADLWRRVFYDFRKMHFYVFKNDLPAVLLQLANADDVEGSALISFLRSGLIPTVLQTPDVQSWTGVIGQSMSAPLLFVMRELRRLSVLPPDRFDLACFYMNSPVRRIAWRLRWITDEERRDYSLGNLVSLSEKVYNEVRQSEHSAELLPYFDLPLQWYAYQNPR